MNIALSQSDVATAYGWGLDALWNGLMTGQTAIRSTQRFCERGFVSDQAAMIPDLSPAPSESRVMAGLTKILRPLVGKLDPMTPLIVATTVGEIEYLERGVLEDKSDWICQSRPQVLVERVKKLLGLRGPAMAFSSACASSSAALTRAASMIRHGEATQVLVVSGDCVSEFVYSGFSTLMSLSAGPAQPFDAERCGLTLGEAVAWALVTPATGAKGELSILGWGNTTDAIHMTAPDRIAGGLARAIGKACAMAKYKQSDLGFIAAHGTGTLYSDAMEMLAFREQFQSARPVFSVKGAIGHTLSAAGLVQILVAGRAMENHRIPPNVGMASADEAAAGWVHQKGVDIKGTRAALSTNSGFGGVNTAILLGRGSHQ